MMFCVYLYIYIRVCRVFPSAKQINRFTGLSSTRKSQPPFGSLQQIMGRANYGGTASGCSLSLEDVISSSSFVIKLRIDIGCNFIFQSFNFKIRSIFFYI